MLRAYLAIGLCTVFWAGNFTAGKIATRSGVDPYLIAGLRAVATAALFYALLPDRRLSRADVRALLPLALAGIAVNHVCFAVGIFHTTPSHSAVIHALIPVFVSVLAWLLLKERLGPAAVAGLVLAVGGALAVVLGATADERRGTLLGDVLTAMGILGFSVYTVLGRGVLQTMGGLKAIAWSFVLSIPVMLPTTAVGLVRQDWARVPWEGWVAFAYMWVFASVVCYRLHVYALARLKAGQVAAFTALQPAIGISIAVAAGQDRLSLPLVAGAVLAVIGIILVQRNPEL
ncbi:MAG TPA: DMT family transporter [Planctomycetota bacterium]|nr:DMT family transporter [Planctomycetota bacterium]